jgi:hypothetical protein
MRVMGNDYFVLGIIALFFLPGVMLLLLGMVCHEDYRTNQIGTQKYIDGKVGRILLPLLSPLWFAAGIHLLCRVL